MSQLPEDDLPRGAHALIYHSITDALFEAQLRGPTLYADEWLELVTKAILNATKDARDGAMADMHRRWLKFALANGIDPNAD